MFFRQMKTSKDYKITSRTKKFFAVHTVTLSNVIKLAKYFYELESFKAGRLLVTKRFKIIVNVMLKVLNISDTLRSKIKRSLYDCIQSYRTKNGSRVNCAPIKRPEPLREAIHNLYYNVKNPKKKYSKRFSVKRILRNKIAALHALGCFCAARRWIDLTRIRWDNMEITNISGVISLKFFIACSKSNQGTRNEGITLMEDGSDLCPVRLFTEFWILCGRPKFGFVFPCQHSRAKYPDNEICDQWLSKRCSGHRLGAKIFTCNGEINGDVTYRIYLNETRKLGFTKLPSKNTFRRLGCIMSHKLELTRDQITTTLGWKYDSVMPNHYLQDQMSTSKDGLAFKLAEKIRNNDFSFLNDISFTH